MSNHPTAEYLHECFLLTQDGTLIWRHRPTHHFTCSASHKRTNKQRSGTIAGLVGKDGYVLVRVGNRLAPAHQIIWAMTKGDWPLVEIDHRDNDRANNRPSNLRIAKRHQNMANMQMHRDNKSGYKGVHLHKQTGKYRAKICHNRKITCLGLHNTPEAAHDAYLRAAERINGDFARG